MFAGLIMTHWETFSGMYILYVYTYRYLYIIKYMCACVYFLIRVYTVGSFSHMRIVQQHEHDWWPMFLVIQSPRFRALKPFRIGPWIFQDIRILGPTARCVSSLGVGLKCPPPPRTGESTYSVWISQHRRLSVSIGKSSIYFPLGFELFGLMHNRLCGIVLQDSNCSVQSAEWSTRQANSAVRPPPPRPTPHHLC
jgi:hypothetical protein